MIQTNLLGRKVECCGSKGRGKVGGKIVGIYSHKDEVKFIIETPIGALLKYNEREVVLTD